MFTLYSSEANDGGISMIKDFQGIEPKIDESCFVAETAVVIGDVRLAENVNVWYGTVMRGDVNYIEVGKNTNIQDNTVVHADSGGFETIIGENVTIGHGAIIQRHQERSHPFQSKYCCQSCRHELLLHDQLLHYHQ